MPYISNSDSDRKKMLELIGVKSVANLLEPIPAEVRHKDTLKIDALTEIELKSHIEEIASANAQNIVCFAGGGLYQHYIPSAVTSLLSRPEFMTAYTPYQAEVAQGTLQVIYEFQTHICRLTGMDIANASMYDGATAAAEALLLVSSLTRRNKVLVSSAVNPLYRKVISTYLDARGLEVVTIRMQEAVTDIGHLVDQLDDSVACVLLSQPNFFGSLEQLDQLAEKVHEVGAKLILSVDPVAQALLKTPGELGADIVVGEGQPLGIPLSFGGPLLGFFAARKEFARYLPGRIAARTTDLDGKTGFVLTLQTREQHIRREKATSNICTNQALCATAATIYLSLLGRDGFKQVALLSSEKAHQTRNAILEVEGYEPFSTQPFVREFAIRTPRPASEIVTKMLRDHSVLPGIAASRWYNDMDDCLIIATTELRTDSDINNLTEGLKELALPHVLSGMQ